MVSGPEIRSEQVSLIMLRSQLVDSSSNPLATAYRRLTTAFHSLLKYSTISAWLQSTGPINLRRMVPSRSMM